MEITNHDITSYIEQIEDTRKKDILMLIEIGKKLTQKEPKMWGTIIGFGSLHYVYPTGHEGNMPLFGLSNRKQAITLYISDQLEELLKNYHLGKYKIGKSCLYIKKLSDINIKELETLIQVALEHTLELPFITKNDVLS